MRLPVLATLLLLSLPPAPGHAAEPPRSDEPEMSALRASFEYGRYAEVLERATARIDQGSLSEAQLIELHRYAGLSAFNLGRGAEAERHFRALLRLEPDFSLDPFVAPPPAVALVERLRQQMASELDLLRQERRLRLERERAEEQRRERERLAEEERRRRLEEMSRQVTVRDVERRSFLVNFVPFGGGQFQQGRTRMGTIFAAAEGIFALTSVIAYFAYESLVEEGGELALDNVLDPDGRATVRGRFIPTQRRTEADTWKLVNQGSAAAFYTVYALGVMDAIFHHEDTVTRTRIETREPPATLPAAPPGASLRLQAAPGGGVGAGVRVHF